MGLRKAIWAGLLAAALAAGCGRPGATPIGETLVKAEGRSLAFTSGITVLVTARIRNGKVYGTQAIEPLTAASVHHLVLTVSGPQGVSAAEIGRADLGNAIRLDGLLPGGTYQLLLQAYRAEGTHPSYLISDDTRSTASIALDETTPVVTLAMSVKLRDQVVDATAQGGLDIRAGDLVVPAVAVASSTPEVSDFVGGGRGFLDGATRFAKFDTPYGLTVDASGNLYVADSGNRHVRQVTPAGLVSTWSPYALGKADMGASPANLVGFADGIAMGASGSVLLADTRLGVVAGLTADASPSPLAGNGSLGLLDGESASASFNLPSGVLAFPDGTVLVADTQNHAIRWISPGGYTYTWLGDGEAGLQDGFGSAVRFNHPTGLALDASGSIYVSDTGNHSIRKIDLYGEVTTLAGTGEFGDDDGPALSARFDGPTGIAVASDGAVFVSDSNNNCIRRISTAGQVTTFSGSGVAGYRNGSHVLAQFNHPTGLAFLDDESLLVADSFNHRIRRLVVR
ncbi:MAG: hypothetical protein FJZ01_20065 [Candidatus Sericytochromatia bacterium]|nr:hypothetical protein [Candidatus Tanganyikabacteria bacterium]